MSKLSSLKLKNITSRNMTIVLQQIVLFFLIYLQYSKKMVTSFSVLKIGVKSAGVYVKYYQLINFVLYKHI